MNRKIMSFPVVEKGKLVGRRTGVLYYNKASVIGGSYLKGIGDVGAEQAERGKTKLQRERQEWGLAPWEYFID